MLCWAAMMMIAANAFSAVPASRAPATRPMSDIERWFGQLADTDPQVRDEAKLRLMGLLRGELDALRMIVESNRPLAPAQSAVLRDIVIHVYLSGEPYEKNMRIGFLGAMLDNMQPVAIVPDHAEQEGRGVSGVLIRETIEGFCAFRYLRTGDVVLGVIGSEVYPTPMSQELQMRVREVLPGEPITLQLLRQGKVIRVTFKVDALPMVAEQRPIEEFRNKRMERAEQYWRVVFEPLVTPDGGEVSVRPAVRRTAANG